MARTSFLKTKTIFASTLAASLLLASSASFAGIGSVTLKNITKNSASLDYKITHIPGTVTTGKKMKLRFCARRMAFILPIKTCTTRKTTSTTGSFSFGSLKKNEKYKFTAEYQAKRNSPWVNIGTVKAKTKRR